MYRPGEIRDLSLSIALARLPACLLACLHGLTKNYRVMMDITLAIKFLHLAL